MTTTEAPVATPYIENDGGDPQPADQMTINLSEYTQCASYKQAKYLAASKRRDGLPAYAVRVASIDRWCVRLSTAPQRYH